MNNELTCTFDINTGVRKGDVLLAVLFNLTLDAAIRKLELNGDIGIISTHLCSRHVVKIPELEQL